MNVPNDVRLTHLTIYVEVQVDGSQHIWVGFRVQQGDVPLLGIHSNMHALPFPKPFELNNVQYYSTTRKY